MNRSMLTATILATVLCTGFASPWLLATRPIEQRRALDAHGRVEIDNLKGRIQVRAWDRNEVHVSGALGQGVEALVIEGDREHLVVRVQYPKQIGAWRGDRTGPTDLLLQVPLRAALDIHSVSADVELDGVAPGNLGIDTVSGDVVAAAAPQHADINSVSGDLRVTLNSADVKVETVSGDVVLRGRLNGQVRGETVSGTLSVDSVGEHLRRLSLGTVSGDVTVRAGLADGGEIKSESVSGDIHLHLPKTLSARVSAESFNGTLSAPGAKIRKQEFGPGSSLEQHYGSGTGEIRIETFSGDGELVLE